jgi:ubiquinone/menaquinone biosynthesis C-methylase UbiE
VAYRQTKKKSNFALQKYLLLTSHSDKMKDKKETKQKEQLPEVFFNRWYSFPITLWGDVRIPKELVELVRQNKPNSALELGCGLGRFTRYMAKQEIQTTGIDCSSVAVAKAKERVAGDAFQPAFMVGNVTQLELNDAQFDVSYDIGCFHCLDKIGQQQYVSELHRVLKPGGVHLLWTLDGFSKMISNMKLNPKYISEVFANKFLLQRAKSSRRRVVQSHWYWFVRN